MKVLRDIVLYTLLLLFSSPSYASTLHDIKARGYLLWGSDAEGGASMSFLMPLQD